MHTVAGGRGHSLVQTMRVIGQRCAREAHGAHAPGASCLSPIVTASLAPAFLASLALLRSAWCWPHVAVATRPPILTRRALRLRAHPVQHPAWLFLRQQRQAQHRVQQARPHRLQVQHQVRHRALHPALGKPVLQARLTTCEPMAAMPANALVWPMPLTQARARRNPVRGAAPWWPCRPGARRAWPAVTPC